jgi:Ethanolamine utilization protein EutJ (predicted chaperonin)
MEKVATIVTQATAGYPVTRVHLVGGSVAFPGFADVMSSVTGWQASVPPSPLFVTPLGIAASAPAVAGGPP